MTKIDQIYESDDPYLEWLRKSKGLSKTTVWGYYKYYRHFVKLDFTQKNINVFLQQKKNNSLVRGFMRSFILFLEVEDRFTIPPKPSGKKKKRIIRNFAIEQIRQVSNYCYDQSLKDGLIFDIIYYGALRRVEITTIKINSFDWDSYDPEKNCKLLIFGKGKKQREVLIPPKVIDKLLDHYLDVRILNKEMNRDDLVAVLSSNTDPLFKDLSEWRVWKNIKRNSERSIGIAIRPHELRHTRATELERSGASIRSIQHYLGHSTPQITEIYLHITQTQSLDKIREIVDN